MKRILFAALMVLECAGCAMLKQEAADRIDLGDGTVFDLVPVSVPEAVADKLVPGSGKAIAMVESELAKKRMAKFGPFNGLPYTTMRSGVLKDGRIFQEDDIAKLFETLTPIVPGAITREVEPARLWAPSGAVIPAGTNGTQGTEGTPGAASSETNGTSWAESDVLLEEIGGGK